MSGHMARRLLTSLGCFTSVCFSKRICMLVGNPSPSPSDKTPVNREHKDPRSESCRSASRKYAPESQLETSSIIIVMYNEELSSIVRFVKRYKGRGGKELGSELGAKV